MNKTRRAAIDKLIEALHGIEDLEELATQARELADEEQAAFDNLPEGLQLAERGQAMETAANALAAMADALEQAASSLSEALSEAETAKEV